MAYKEVHGKVIFIRVADINSVPTPIPWRWMDSMLSTLGTNYMYKRSFTNSVSLYDTSQSSYKIQNPSSFRKRFSRDFRHICTPNLISKIKESDTHA